MKFMIRPLEDPSFYIRLQMYISYITIQEKLNTSQVYGYIDYSSWIIHID